MDAIRLNSLTNDVFAYTSNDDSVLKLNSKELSRDKLIALGRLATVEYLGNEANKNSMATEKYKTRLNGKNYASFAKDVWKDTILYCANTAAKNIGAKGYETIEQVRADRSLYLNQTFLATLQYISQEVISPLFVSVMDDATNRLITWDSVQMGETKIYDIESNDFFAYEDDSFGGVSSKPAQYLYKSQIAVTPKPYTAVTKFKWYQDIIGGEAGKYYAKFMQGAINKMYATMIEQFKRACANTKYMPSAYIFPSYTVANWNSAITYAKEINGVDGLFALGTRNALSKVLPTTGVGAAAAGIQGMIGDEWVKNGFLGNVGGVDLIECKPVVVPHTMNYGLKSISLDDTSNEVIYILAKGGRSPMVGVQVEGSPITLTMTPDKDADMSITISSTIIFDVQPMFSQKVMKITL